MFSKKEKEYLTKPESITQSYRRVLKHRIREKVSEFYKEELPLLQERGITEFYNGITEFNNEEKRARRDSNPRPNAPQAFALSMLCNEPHDLEKFAFNVVSV